ncbi:MAG: response regulator [Gammaproteobacteria bacterium]|nr:response regulator [Gammaproteobacteria bacterium]MCW8973730.1 response regulator [Gammaproteobacteria bacterium]MCW8993706.1 response regulator [Gammaproteobacteria bacterium]
MISANNTTRLRLKERNRAGKPKLIHRTQNGLNHNADKSHYILILDDQSTGRRILEEIIHTIDRKLEIASFDDPYEALEKVRLGPPDLILTDYRMPQMNGVEFIKRVRETSGCTDIPIVMITVVGERSVRYEALNAGATDFLTRPLDQYECTSRCRNLLIMRQQQSIIQDRAKWLEKQVEIATHQVLSRERETLLRLAKAGEYRDEETGNHILRIARYSRTIAEYLGLSSADCDEIEYAAPMHDIGKIGIPDHILLKPGELTADEWAIMKQHSIIGHSILADSESRFIQAGAIIALSHHERFDGTGYPYGLIGEAIPLSARIVAIADVYDALRSERPYKGGWVREDAACYISGQSGKHFDPACVEAFLKQLERIYDIEASLADESNSHHPTSCQ